MTRRADATTIFFITEQSVMGPDAARFVYRMADVMSATGYDTALLNVGDGIPRPNWLVPPALPVPDVDALRVVLARHGDRAYVPTTWQLAYVAAELAAAGAPAAFLANDLHGRPPADLLDARLMLRSFSLMPVLTASPVVAGALAPLGVAHVHSLPVPVDAPFFAPADADAEEGSVLIHCDPGLSGADEIAAGIVKLAAAQQTAVKLSAFGFGTKCKYVPGDRFTRLEWHDDDSYLRPGLYARASCFLWTRPHDSLCLPVLEAMSVGCPVVAFEGAGTAGWCADGENCLLVPDGDVEAAAEAVVRVMQDAELRAALAAGGRETARSHTWEAFLDALPDFIQGLRRPEGARGLWAVGWE